MSKEKKNSESNKKNNKNRKNNKDKNFTETKEINTKSKDTKKNKNEKKVEKKIIEEAIIENEELEMEENLEIDENINEEINEEIDEDNEDFEIDEDNEDFESDEDLEDEIDEDNETGEENNDEETIENDEIVDKNITEEEIIIKPIENKKEKNKKKKEKEEKLSKENIKKIEKIAKDKNKKNKNKTNNVNKINNFLDENMKTISGLIAGILLTILVVIIIWPDRIATLKDGTQPVVKVAGKNYTANYLYDKMKSHYSVSQLLDAIDTDILTKKYKENDEMLEEVKSNADYYINMYQQYYGYTEEEFLEANGFSSYDKYMEYLKLDYRRKKYLDEYVEKNLEDDEIQKYYDENVYGDINCQHILVESTSEESEDSKKLSDKDAKKLVEEIIDKINDGTSWKDIQKEYKDKITFEDLGYQTWDSNLEEPFKNALKDMKDESFSEEPVKTSYGYHVIYRMDQKKAPSLKKTKKTIIENIVKEKQSEDENLLYKALISLREEKNIKFSDTDMKSKYEAYIKKYK